MSLNKVCKKESLWGSAKSMVSIMLLVVVAAGLKRGTPEVCAIVVDNAMGIY